MEYMRAIKEFQFYDSPIKRIILIPLTLSTTLNFNSMIVRLKDICQTNYSY